MFCRLLFSLIFCGTAVALPTGGLGAELALRGTASVGATVVRVADLGDVRDADPEVAARIADRMLTLAPPLGEIRYLRASQVHELLLAQGLGEVRVVGADAVALERTAAAVATPTWDPQAVSADVAVAIAAALAEAAGQGPWKVDVIGDAKTLAPLAAAARPLFAAGGAAPWTGRQEFLVRGADGGPAQAVFVRVTRFERAVVAVRSIERGQIISPADVELRELDGSVPSLACRTLDSAIGREARQALRAGSVVQTSQVHAPIVVRRGETVTVAARADGIVVKTLAEARQDGGIGELVQVEAVDGRRRERFMARVTGRRQCEVYAAGVAADDFAWR